MPITLTCNVVREVYHQLFKLSHTAHTEPNLVGRAHSARRLRLPSARTTSNVDFLQFAPVSRRECLWTPCCCPALACAYPTIGSYPRGSCWELKHSFVRLPTTFVRVALSGRWNSIILFFHNGFCLYTFIIGVGSDPSEWNKKSGWKASLLPMDERANRDSRGCEFVLELGSDGSVEDKAIFLSWVVFVSTSIIYRLQNVFR